MIAFNFFCKFALLCILLSSPLTLSNCTSGQHQPDDLPLMSLQALQTKSPNGLSGTITVYDLFGKVYLTKDLIFTADAIYSPHLSLPKNTTYRLIIVFYYDNDLPVAFLDEDISVGAADSYSFSLNKENVHFSLSEITSESVLASLSTDVDTGILPDLDLDDDGFSNIVEFRGGSDPRDETSIPHGPDFDSIDVEYAADGNLVTITVQLSDGNYVTSIEASVANYGYLQRGDIFTEDLSGDDLDNERTYTLSFNPQYAPVGEITLNFTATNSIDLTSTDSVTLTISNNSENVGPVIVFDSLSADDVLTGEIELVIAAYDRDTITNLDLTSPTSVTDTASEAAYFVGNWDTGSQNDGNFTVIAEATDILGENTTRRLAISINNGTDGSGPRLQMTIQNPSNTDVEIDFQNGEPAFGIAPFSVIANDASDVSYIQLQNVSDLNCTGVDLNDCPLTNHNDGLDDFITSHSAYNNSFDTTLYADGDSVAMSYLAGDSHGSTNTRTFTFTIQNTPIINSISTSTTTVINGDELQISWNVVNPITTVTVLDAADQNMACTEGVSSDTVGFCTFIPTASQAYTVHAAYSTENQFDEIKIFSADQQTEVVQVDFDADAIVDELDNCYKTANSDQADSDNDGHGDLCDPDKDDDGYVDAAFILTDFATLYGSDDPLYQASTYASETEMDCDDLDGNVHPHIAIFDFAVNDCGSSTSDEGVFDFIDGYDDKIWAGSTTSFLGEYVTWIGDVDSDNINDLIVGSYYRGSYLVSGANFGSGVTLDVDTDALASFRNDMGTSSLVYSSPIDDFNGDGIDDFVIRSHIPNSYQGVIYLFDGTIRGSQSPSDASAIITGSASSQRLGYTFASGYLNSNSNPDIVTSEPFNDSSRGTVYIFNDLSSGNFTPSDANQAITGENTNNYFGTWVVADDFDGDGLDDLFATAYNYDGAGGTNTGKVYFIPHANIRSGSVLSLSTLTIEGVFTEETTGYYLNLVPDMDGDSRPEILIGEPRADLTTPPDSDDGETHLFLSQSIGTTGAYTTDDADYTFQGNVSDDSAGNIASGDINDDGIGDFAIGARGAATSNGTGAGKICIFDGSQILQLSPSIYNYDTNFSGSKCFSGASGSYSGLSLDIDNNKFAINSIYTGSVYIITYGSTRDGI